MMPLQELRYALRRLRQSPGFTITAILTLALGIGALTTVATWTSAVAYDPWPHVQQPRDLRFIDATVLGNQGYSVRFEQMRFVREHSRSFKEAAGFSLSTVNLTMPGAQPMAISTGIVSSNYFHLLGLQPQIGRFFDPAANDRDFGANDGIVLSDALWRERFGADRSIVGRTLLINRHVFTVVGVVPRDFTGIFGGLAESAWVPLSALRDLSPDPAPDPLQHFGLQVVVRLQPGVRHETAAAELHNLAQQYVLQSHDSNLHGWGLNLRDSAHFERGLFSVIGEQLPVLIGASALLMILVCINIASLLSQHAARSRRDVAIRMALGATPARVAQQVFLETALLAVAGALGGWAASIALSRTLYLLLPSFGITLAFNLRSDTPILLLVAAVSVLVTMLVGMYPVRQALRVSQQEAMRRGGLAVSGAQNRLGARLLLSLQLGICFVVLVCCGLLTRTAVNIFSQKIGFDRNNCLTAGISLARSGYNKERGLAFQAALVERLRNAPGVRGATLTSHLPMGDDGAANTQDFSIPGYVPAKGEDMEVITDFEGPDFFHTMGIAMQQGREFTVQDTPTSPYVAVINPAMARRYWPKGDAVGHSIVMGGAARQIVGIVGDYTYYSPDSVDPTPILYIPLMQNYNSGVKIAVRSQTDAAAVEEQLRHAVASLDAALPLEDVRTLDEVSADRYQMSRIPAELIGVYAACSVLVAMMGLYAVMAYSVIERHREFALRIALGSTRLGIFRLVLGGSSWVALLGIVVGGAGSIAAVRVLRSMLFGVAPFDPLSYCAAGVLLLSAVFVSGLWPARRAAAIEPMQALRTE